MNKERLIESLKIFYPNFKKDKTTLIKYYQNQNVNEVISDMRFILKKIELGHDIINNINLMFRIFFISYNDDMYDVMIYFIDVFMDMCNNIDKNILKKYQMFLLQHYIQIYPFIQKRKKYIYLKLTKKYSILLEEKEKQVCLDDYNNFLDKYKLNNEYFKLISMFHLSLIKKNENPVKDIMDYIYEKRSNISFTVLEWHNNYKMYNLTVLSFTFIRKILEEEGEYINNDFLEVIIDTMEDIINIVLKNVKNVHPQSIFRVSTLISAKNLLKYRYNMDNNKWNDSDIADTFLREITVVLENNLHSVKGASFSQGISTLAQVQMIYNTIMPRKSLYDMYKKEVKKFSAYSQFSGLKLQNMFDIKDNDKLIMIEMYEVSLIYRLSVVFNSSELNLCNHDMAGIFMFHDVMFFFNSKKSREDIFNKKIEKKDKYYMYDKEMKFIY